MRLHQLPGYGIAYQTIQRAMHKAGLHKTHRIGPLMPGNTIIEKCSWCGISRVVDDDDRRNAAAQMGCDHDWQGALDPTGGLMAGCRKCGLVKRNINA